MTREEAISVMNVIIHMLEPQYDNDRVEEAVDMAIKALKQEPCEDCISRAEAIKALEYELSIEAGGGLDKYRTVIKDLLSTIYNIQKKAIEDLPSIQPKEKTGHWIKCFCSECGEEAITEWDETGGEWCLSNYCPNCGAKMIEPQESEDKGQQN